MVTIISFGYKHGGPPLDANVVVDVRFLWNPYQYKHLRHLRGTDARVQEAILDESFVQVSTLVNACKRIALLQDNPRIAIGCTGGHHRSVCVAELLAREIGGKSVVLHRDLERR